MIVTRGHRDDMRVLRWAVQTPARYIGMIGSKRKTITIFRELQKEGLRRELFERVHAPIGLDIGAVTPEEIAVAITAELIAVRRKVRARPAAHELVPSPRSQHHRAPRMRSPPRATTSPPRALAAAALH